MALLLARRFAGPGVKSGSGVKRTPAQGAPERNPQIGRDMEGVFGS
jgi:hypothetical protein